ncbi:protein of unknown function [Candidatus Filomicrobium marinum]|uniref:Uncharacterized protein n=1 Tax=Candidatus Filomicrobium marinum TaxID=1608628 RepID=A0A0D6JK73_9HYPH|nr:protein of unknown function [Candidatus Filomicrobium marinum]CPR22363.1 protein of unknown function [Candidatus Filomicrobium marinum]
MASQNMVKAVPLCVTASAHIYPLVGIDADLESRQNMSRPALSFQDCGRRDFYAANWEFMLPPPAAI